MKLSHFFSVFSICLKMGMRNIFADKILVFGSFWVYTILIVLYSGVIRLIPQDIIAPFGLTVNQMIWYVATTEFVIFSSTEWWFKEFQMDIVNARIHLTMIKPFPAFWLRIFVWLGEGVARMFFTLPLFLGLATLLTGEMIGFVPLLGILASVPCAVIIMAAGSYIVGGSCLWFSVSEPAFWIWQKCIFLFGALIWPLALYPEWAREVLFYTPFPSVLAWAGNWTLEQDGGLHLIGYAHQIVWTALILFIVWRFEKRIFHAVQVRGA